MRSAYIEESPHPTGSGLVVANFDNKENLERNVLLGLCRVQLGVRLEGVRCRDRPVFAGGTLLGGGLGLRLLRLRDLGLACSDQLLALLAFGLGLARQVVAPAAEAAVDVLTAAGDTGLLGLALMRVLGGRWTCCVRCWPLSVIWSCRLAHSRRLTRASLTLVR